MISSDEIADALGRFRPTAQQRAVIESDLAPALVIAGAGSGKTETMAGRVLWLLANGFVQPSEILGLTFTRKAAGELSARIRERVTELARVGLLPGEYDPFDAPNVSTYNSYANSLFRDNAAALGRESDGSVLGEAAAWQLARRVVTKSRDARLPDLGKNLEPVTKAVLSLARAMAENDVDGEELRGFAREFHSIADLPNGGRGGYAEVAALAETVGSLDVLIDLAAEFQAVKATRGLIEYSDQVSLALRIVRGQPKVAEGERARYRVVLLDEYQDTSVVQTWLLAELFAGHPVMAVGDPNQSIYGWRGASASNLDDFARAFEASDRRFVLSTSWRNGRRILDAANAVVAPFAQTSRVRVEKLVAGPAASEDAVDSIFAESVVDEAEEAARWLGERLSVPDEGDGPPSAAMLFRTRKTQAFFLAALGEAGIKYHVLGLNGLLAEPEIADLVSALSVVSDPNAGLELLRLLAGSRWRLGVQDLHALNRLASRLRDLDYAQHPLPAEVKERLRMSVADGEGGSIVDALDFIATARPEHGFLSGFSEIGLERLRSAGRFFARLRSRAGLDLRDFVIVVLQELQLDIEIVANEFRVLGSAPVDAFLDALSGYLAIDDTASLRGFLTWLREAEQREDLSPRPEDPEPGTVQILTVHGAKGLEWDHVVVPRLVEDELPARPLEGFRGWTAFGQLPWPFRGDADELPVFPWREATTRKEIVDAVKRFSDEVRARSLDEERRLAYVAITRARHGLLLSGSFWARQKRPRIPSPFLRELADAGIVAPLPAAAEAVDNPLGDRLDRVVWPFDPLGSRRPAVERAAQSVLDAEPVTAGFLAPQLDLLLEERRLRLETSGLVTLPTRVPASRFKDYVTDPASVASSLRRPMPERPYRATQLGTLFHSWVEDRYGLLGAPDDIDSLVTELDTEDLVDEAELARLKAVFEASPWGSRSPIDVEREIHLPFDGQIVVCKIDAVYQNGDRFEVVDWKTGKPPRDATDLEQKQLQLALYRLAYARWKGIDPELIDAVFYFVATDRIVRPERIFSEAELLERWRASFAR
ncbi:MAG TPA: ATP-dependent DNA helicase [Lacisediminihabitans sp.]|uniref:ATP-dependent DNA helicase n=1 Tax=Lacisediminihabitans sp. TaxID=2787631 RepID=UPI002EDAE979